jgi:hypothetical protein
MKIFGPDPQIVSAENIKKELVSQLAGPVFLHIMTEFFPCKLSIQKENIPYFL